MASQKKAFLGVGWKFPIDVDRRRGVAMSQYEDNIYESLIIILGTALGERVMRPDFGCAIHDTRPATCRHYEPGSSELCPQFSKINR